MTPPRVTVLIPARNEVRSIVECISAVGAQDIGAHEIQLVLIDGDSGDGTAELGRAAAEAFGFADVRLLANPRRTTPGSLNIGLAAAAGSIVCRVDARSFIPDDYVRRCTELLADERISVVGGVQLAVAEPDADLVARGIARALRNPYATGLARYRRRRSSGPADTCYLGAFRTNDLREVGGWDERFATNQDFELNTRMRARGIAWFERELVVMYRPRSDLRSVAAQHRRFGRWKAGAWTETGMSLSPRHVVLLAAPPLGAAMGLVLALHQPVATVLAAGVAALAVDALGREPAGPGERMVATVAMVVVAGSWWLGIVEQLVRRLGGQRLLALPQSS